MHARATTNPPQTSLEIQVNGARHRVRASGDTPLLYVLRNELSLNGPKFGCGLAQCGACTVHLGGEAVRSCITPVSAAAAAPVVTIEGLAGGGAHATPVANAANAANTANVAKTANANPDRARRWHPLQQAFIDEQAGQCGYCLSGMIMSAAALLKSRPKPTEQELRAALDGNLCRCGSHLRILRAVRRVAGTRPPGATAASIVDELVEEAAELIAEVRR